MSPVTMRRPMQKTQPAMSVLKFAKLGSEKTGAKLKASSANDDTRGIIMTRSSMQVVTTLHFGGTGLHL